MAFKYNTERLIKKITSRMVTMEIQISKMVGQDLPYLYQNSSQGFIFWLTFDLYHSPG